MLKVQRAFRRSKKRQCRHESATLSLRCIAVRKLRNRINYPLESLYLGSLGFIYSPKIGILFFYTALSFYKFPCKCTSLFIVGDDEIVTRE